MEVDKKGIKMKLEKIAQIESNIIPIKDPFVTILHPFCKGINHNSDHESDREKRTRKDKETKIAVLLVKEISVTNNVIEKTTIPSNTLSK